MASLAELTADLAEVSLCISKILGANTQEHWTGGVDRHRSPELTRLFEERRVLRDEIATHEDSDGGGVGSFQRIEVID